MYFHIVHCFQTVRKGISKSMSQLKIAASGWELRTMQFGEQTAHTEYVRKSGMALRTTILAIFNSVVWIIVIFTECIHSRVALTFGFLMLVGLCLIPL